MSSTVNEMAFLDGFVTRIGRLFVHAGTSFESHVPFQTRNARFAPLPGRTVSGNSNGPLDAERVVGQY